MIGAIMIGATVISATILCSAIGAGAAFAQTPATPAASTAADTPPAFAAVPMATAAPPAAAGAAKPKLSPDEKKKISQECSTQADDKKLHGKDRQKFRSTCIRHGGASA
jgi:hypothetical protein